LQLRTHGKKIHGKYLMRTPSPNCYKWAPIQDKINGGGGNKKHSRKMVLRTNEKKRKEIDDVPKVGC